MVQRIDIEVAEAKIDDKAVLLHIEHGKYYNFNSTSTDIWDWIQSPRKVQELCNLVADKYDCTEEQCYPDILAFLNELVSLNMLKVD